MAITQSVVHNYVKGDRREIVYSVALDSSYPTGGYAFTNGLPGNTVHNVQFENGNGYRPQFDYSANKIKVYTSAATETTNATDLSAITLRVTVTGK